MKATTTQVTQKHILKNYSLLLDKISTPGASCSKTRLALTPG